ncbi:hypothetical protein [Amycolatopsis jejuensis]|uniref:hypothetical protein n=1 Tax=Amycolatopsis jejuensis TaxID=330084 RepID=UPI00052716C3|nr:hypothetical protein [Amycolatopsis jejuensis]
MASSGSIRGELPAADVAAEDYAVHQSAKDNRNHRYARNQAGNDVLWPKCTRGMAVPQRMVFSFELSPELGDDRDHGADCRTCFSTGPRAPRTPLW